eukprot:CAMPEP_0172548362 /NCGR_PEP_ID=MMETSP1067-20121228/17669_1 /TAXON_ID=265564 ORGANISM="Thalassiosira punctigera, Strain Tpunct2005C2" /NCGR_SAMPLE_ID=MMETSP1067 /ASSEMBLY_ACC=CAM_ASM_000444 /LENGTH=417 /DNA_ID=CAMNT_0013335569 /DNA_START=160 /DNA_END=1413 /DNA_ORIENTATION=-
MTSAANPRVLSYAVLALTASAVYTSFNIQLIQPNPQHGGFEAPPSTPGRGGGREKRMVTHQTLEELTGNPIYISCPEPLLPMYDRIVSANATAGGNDDGSATATLPPPRKIPRTIHASMRSRCLSPDTHAALESWKSALPYHSFYLHDDDAVDRLFNTQFEDFPALNYWMRCVRFKGAMRIDVWRILIIYLYGGIYTDVDMFPTDNFNEFGPIQVDDEAFFLSDGWNRPSQWFFGMEPNHPVAYYTLHEIFDRLSKLEFIERPNVVFVTGPDAVKFGYGRATLGWTIRDSPDVFAPGIHQCRWGKTVTKLYSGKYINQLDMEEMVMWNNTSTEKMTRKAKINKHHGMMHWMDEKNSKKVEFDGSCIDYLYSLKHGLTSEHVGTYSEEVYQQLKQKAHEREMGGGTTKPSKGVPKSSA